MIKNFIKKNDQSTPCEISIFGYCQVAKKHRLFHINHRAKDQSFTCDEFQFIDQNSIHIMGCHQSEVRSLILSARSKVKKTRKKEFWHSPKNTIRDIVRKNKFSDIGGELKLGGSSFPAGFTINAIYDRNRIGELFLGEKPKLIYQGINLFSDSSLMKVGECSVNISSIEY